MTEHNEKAELRRWIWVMRSQLLAAAAGGVLALAVLQAIDPSASGALALVAVVAGEGTGSVIGNTAAGSVVGHRERPVRRPGSIASFALILGIAAIVGLVAYLLAGQLGLHLRHPAATFIAICPLFALFASESVDGRRLRSAD